MLAAGGEFPDAVVERLWNIIQALNPSKRAAGNTGGDRVSRPHPKAAPGAAIPGLALENTRDYAKQLDQVLLEEAQQHKPANEADEQPSNSKQQQQAADGKTRERRRDSDRDRDRDSRRNRSRSRERRRRYGFTAAVAVCGWVLSAIVVLTYPCR